MQRNYARKAKNLDYQIEKKANNKHNEKRIINVLLIN